MAPRSTLRVGGFVDTWRLIRTYLAVVNATSLTPPTTIKFTVVA